MRAASKYLFFLGLILTYSMAQGAQVAYGVPRAPSLDGLTGLLTMNMPHTMGAGMTAIGGVTMAGALTGQYSDLTVATAALRIGFSDNVEIGLKSKTYNVEYSGGGTDTGLGDSEGMIKWKFREENENLLAMALGLGVILPTGDETKGFKEVDTIGLKFSVTASGEHAVYDDAYVGLYFEGQAIAIDPIDDNSPYKEMYGKLNAGLAFPISDNNSLSFFTEFNLLTNKDKPGVERNHTAITPGLRYANDNLSLTFAGQMVNYENTSGSQKRLIGLFSLGF